MRCDQAREQIGRLFDGELSAAERQTLGAHTAECLDCARYRDEFMRLRHHLEETREAAPNALIQRVRASLAVEAAAQENEQENGPALPSARPAAAAAGWIGQRLRRNAGSIAAVIAACVLSIAGTWWWMDRANARDTLARDVLSAHVRALMQDNVVQVASTDSHTVKPWFSGRLEFTPTVKDLSAEGFQLVGGRLDYVGGHRVATLIYKRRLHQVSVFVWPDAGGAAVSAHARINGYNIEAWSKAGMTFWAASDLNEAELRELQSLL